jgi:hypothetical protein
LAGQLCFSCQVVLDRVGDRRGCFFGPIVCFPGGVHVAVDEVSSVHCHQSTVVSTGFLESGNFLGGEWLVSPITILLPRRVAG